MRFAFLLLLVSLLGASTARATHIVGGELDLQYLRGNTYQLTLNLYFDARYGDPGALDTELTAAIFDKATDQRMASLTLPLVSNTFLNYTQPVCAINDLQTRALVYRNTIELPPGIYAGTKGYYVAVERCCRNRAIDNIVAPVAAGQAFYLEFPAVVRDGQPFRDSTPRVFPPVADYACLGELFTYDFGGQDPDGDSLAYELITPLNGHADPVNSKPPVPFPAPYADISWNPGLSTLLQIPGLPPLAVNARTGRLTVRPDRLGLFVFGVRCTEYRQKVRLGETRRDFQLLVLNCPRNRPPQLALLPTASGQVVYKSRRDTLRFGPGRPACVRLRFTDPDNNSRLTLSLQRPAGAGSYAGPLPSFTTASSGTVRGPGQPDTLLATLCFSPCTDTQGNVARLDVLVADEGCPLPKRDTVHILLIGAPPTNAAPVLTTNAGPALPLRVRPGQTLAFDLTAIDADGDPILFTLGGAPAGFAPAALGAVLVPAAQAGTTRTARLSWPVDCRAIADPPGTVRELLLQASSTTSCGTVRLSNLVRVPVVVDYQNQPPVLTSTLPVAQAAPGAPVPLVELPLGQPYSATLLGTDADLDVLTLSAQGQGFDLAAAGMRFVATPSPAGQASGTFTWLPTCAGDAAVVRGVAQELTVVFTLQEATCRAQPQTRTARFRVRAPTAPAFVPPNIVLPLSQVAANRVFTLPTLPPDFCDARFAGIKIFSRWGRLIYESPDRGFAWAGEGAAGLYYYLLTFENGPSFKGWVEIVR